MGNRRQHDGFRRPAKDVEVHDIAAVRASAPPFTLGQDQAVCVCGPVRLVGCHKWSAARAVYAFAVLLQKRPHLSQTSRVRFLDRSIGTWTDIKQKVPISYRTTDQPPEALLKRAKLVFGLVRPLRPDRSASLPGALILEQADRLFGELVTGEEFAEFLTQPAYEYLDKSIS